MPAGTHLVFPRVFFPFLFTHLEGLSVGFSWVEDSLGLGVHSEVSDGWDCLHSLALQPHSL